MKRILDPSFKYVHSSKSDISVGIKRELKRLAKLAELKAHFNNVAPIRKEDKS